MTTASSVNPARQRFRLQFTKGIREVLGVEFTELELKNWPAIKPEIWVDKFDELETLINQLCCTLRNEISIESES